MKFFAGLNEWMLPLAAFASFAFGGVWYGVLSKTWMAAANLNEEKIGSGAGRAVVPLVITLLAQMFMAWMLAGIILHMAKAGIPASARNGMVTAAFIWAGFIMTTLIVNHEFQMQKRLLTLIDGAHWLGVMLIQGAVLGAWGLR